MVAGLWAGGDTLHDSIRELAVSPAALNRGYDASHTAGGNDFERLSNLFGIFYRADTA
jgi:hypothetical protein